MLSPTNFWMCFAGLIYLAAGVLILRKEISAARGWDKLITLGCICVAVPLAVFAPEHFRGPMFVQNVVPSWMPARAFWPCFVGCALLAAATSLTVRKFVRLSSTLLGLMFFLFVCMIYIPSALAHPKNRFVWAYALRDLSFAGGAWALAGLQPDCIVEPRPRNNRNG
ncbi:DoxX (fragment) [Candidatus Sulfopaludibacter sp. SbA3]